MITLRVSAPSTTWWLVMMKPSELITTPLPEPSRPDSSSRLWTVTIEGMAWEATTATRSVGANTGTVVSPVVPDAGGFRFGQDRTGGHLDWRRPDGSGAYPGLARSLLRGRTVYDLPDLDDLGNSYDLAIECTGQP